ncbi:MAG: hypothetical protein Q8S09_01235 [Hyphomonas sp.]|nr:hypothetical protein [Hyphomonas sp.]
MTRTRLALAAAASTLVLAGCQYWPWKSDTTATVAPDAAKPVTVTVGGTLPAETVAGEAPPVTETEACAVLDSRGWEAWINKMPGPGAVATLHVIGKVDVRTGGYTFTWQEGPMDRSAVPALRLKLVPKAPDGMATMAITTEDVAYQAPALSSGYSRVIISCGGTTLGEITEVMDVY